MERMLIKHLSGSKANQVEEFALKHHNDLTFGRDNSATVKYDPDRDDLVGREHARIGRNPNDPNGFTLTDLSSKNGTFLNGQRITGSVDLAIGDRVQFGPGGPEFTFDVEPRPADYAKATRISDAGTATPATRVSEMATATAAAGAGTRPPGSVGKATVERMITETASETRREQGRKYGMIGGVAGLLLLLVIGALAAGGYYMYTKRQSAEDGLRGELTNKSDDIQRKIAEDKAAAPLTAGEIANKNNKAVVQINMAWHLQHPIRQTQVYHLHLPQVMAFKIDTPDVSLRALIVGPAIPVYVQTNNGQSYEPVLVEEKGQFNMPVGSVHQGTGFIVTPDGYVMTNKHIAYTWLGSYPFPPGMNGGIVLAADYSRILAAGVRPPNDWVPENTVSAGGTIGALNMRFTSGADYTGVRDYMKVSLSGREGRLDALPVQPAERHDVALIKINSPGELTKAELNDNYDTLQKGESLVIMGYPAITPPQYGVIPSQNMFDTTTKLSAIPNPTVTVTSVSNILRSNTKDQDNQVRSSIGDAIQLATGSTGPGNSGGPVFDMSGRVIGIYFAFSTLGDVQYAVPIRYGKKLMEN